MNNSSKCLFFLLLGLLLFSCKETEKEKLAHLLNEWDGKEIMYPDNMKFTILGHDTTLINHADYTIVTYVDSIGCTSCKLKLPEWRALITELDSMENISASVLIFMHPKNRKEVESILKRDRFDYSVCIDESDSFNKLNKFPSDMKFQTFLLDKQNKVVAIGNPIHNPKVKELYLNILLGDKAPIKVNEFQTNIKVDKMSVDMGLFDWQEEQKATFTFTNTGTQPLVIIDASTSCGCTLAEYPKEPIAPGKDAKVEVIYKADRPEHFDKTITVYCNAADSPIVLKIKGKAQ